MKLSRSLLILRILVPLLIFLLPNNREIFGAPVARVAIVDLLPDSASKQSAAATITESLGYPVVFVDPTPVLKMLQWTTNQEISHQCLNNIPTIKSALTTIDPLSMSLPPPTLFESLLDTSRARLLAGRFEESLFALDTAQLALWCVNYTLNPDVIQRMFFIRTMTHANRYDDLFLPSLENLLAVAPDGIHDGDLPADLHPILSQVRSRFAVRSGVGLGGELEHFTLRIDGRTVSVGDVLFPGWHVVQVQGYQETRTSFIQIADTTSEITFAQLGEQAWNREADILQNVIGQLRAGNLDAELQDAFNRCLVLRNEIRMLIAVAGVNDEVAVWEVRLKQSPRRVAGFATSQPSSNLNEGARESGAAVLIRTGVARTTKSSDPFFSVPMQIELHKHISSHFHFGFGLQLAEYFAPTRGLGATLSARVPPSIASVATISVPIQLPAHLTLLSGVGYQGGQGSPLQLHCTTASTGGATDASENDARCSSESQEGASEITFKSWWHGPIVRMDLAWYPSQHGSAFSLLLGGSVFRSIWWLADEKRILDGELYNDQGQKITTFDVSAQEFPQVQISGQMGLRFEF